MAVQSFDAPTWNEIIARLPGAHLLQSWEWGEVKSGFGWQPSHHVWYGANDQVVAAALLLERTIPVQGLAARLRVLYVPKGPLLDWKDSPLRQRVLKDLGQLARKRSAIFLKIDPDVVLGRGIPGTPNELENLVGASVLEEMKAGGWKFSEEQVQFRNTVLMDLSQSEEQVLAGMKPKTRYNIRLAQRKGVVVRQGDGSDFSRLYRMYAETSTRDGFVIREEGYYQALWKVFFESGFLDPLVAELSGVPIAGAMIFYFSGKAYFLNGMSRQEHRDKMPSYLLQWEAIKRAKARGCLVYDMWGAPDAFDESDSMWGVYRFKEGFGGVVIRTIGAWDLPIKPLWYRMYAQVLPRILDVLRLQRNLKTRRLIG